MNTIKMSKVLALIVVVAMVMAVVPCFTAFAAEVPVFDANEIEVDAGGEIAAEAVTGVVGPWNVKISNNFDKDGVWVTEETAETAEYGAPALMFFRGGTRGDNNDETLTATFENGAKTAGATAINVEYSFASQVEDNLYQTIELVDLDGEAFARMYFDIGNGVVDAKADPVIQNAEMHFGYEREADDPSTEEEVETTPDFTYIARAEDSRDQVMAARGKAIKISAVVEEDKTLVTYTVDGDELGTDTVPFAINGIGAVKAGIPQWNNQYAAAALMGLKVDATVPDTMKEVTVTYTADGEEVTTETRTYNASTEESVTFNAKTVVFKGDIWTADEVTLSDSASVTMAKAPRYASKQVGDTVKVGDDYYRVTGDSVVLNGNFAYGTTAWTNRNKNTEPKMNVGLDDELQTNVLSGNTAGADAENSLGTEWKVEVGQTYYVALAVKTTGIGDSNLKFNRIANLPKSYDFNGNAESDEDIIRFGKEVSKDNTWNNFEAVFTATNDTVTLVSSWVDSISFANVEILPVEAYVPDTQVEYTITVKAGDAELDTITGKAEAGDVVQIEENQVKGRVGKDYYATKAEEISIEAGKSEYTVEAVKVASITGFEPVEVTTVGDYEPMLPDAVQPTVDTEGFEAEALPVTWAGNEGTVDDTGLTVTANVNTLAKTYGLIDTVCYAGQNNYERASARALKLPAAADDTFAIEFTVKYNKASDQWIIFDDSTIGASYFGPNAIYLGFNGNFVAVDGNGTGGRNSNDTGIMALNAGETYTVLVEVDATNYKYTATIVDSEGNVAVAKDRGFRTNGKIDRMTTMSNGLKTFSNDASFEVVNIQAHQDGIIVPTANEIETALNYIADGADKDTLVISADVTGELEGKNLVVTAIDSAAEHAVDTEVHNDVAVAAAALVPNSANMTYEFKVVDAETGYATGVAYAVMAPMVISDIAANLDEYATADQMARVAQAVAALNQIGAVYELTEDGAKFNDGRDSFITADVVPTEDSKTIVNLTVNEGLFANGFGFKVGIKAGTADAAVAAEGVEDEVFQSITVADGTVTVQAADGSVYTFSLDAVQIEFVATEVDEADAGADADFGLVDEL